MRVTDIVLQWKYTRRMQVGIDIGNERDGYHLTVGETHGMLVGFVLVLLAVTSSYRWDTR